LSYNWLGKKPDELLRTVSLPACLNQEKSNTQASVEQTTVAADTSKKIFFTLSPGVIASYWTRNSIN
jgi:hypothetical protein